MSPVDYLAPNKHTARSICVTGMHRSGTSLTSMWLRECGIGFAPNHYLSTASLKFNPKGHYEDIRVVSLHDASLRSLAPASNGWVVTKNGDYVFNEAQKQIAMHIISSYENQHKIWGFKDPRMLLFLESWKALLPDLKLLCVWRPAEQVVESLLKRAHGSEHPITHISRIDAINCWKVYNQQLLRFCASYPDDTIVISLNELIRNSERLLPLMEKKFVVSLNRTPIEKFFDRNLLSHCSPESSHISPAIRSITTALEELSVRF